MSSVEETYIGQASTFMRKSVENVVSASHDVIGSSISQALAFTNQMTLPANNESAPKTPQSAPTPGESQRSQSPSAQAKLNQTTSVTTTEPENTFLYCVKASNNDSITNTLAVPPSRPSSQKSQRDGSSPVVEKRDISLNNLERSADSCKMERGDKEKKKKKSSWLNVLYPTYKSRSEDFKRIFKDVPDDERLVVDYSCALQKEILVHGRLYVSQNYLCFYANIFGWETLVCLQWKDVTAITKEKTALVIPNAILVSTHTDKMFFTSFGTRDKAYLMLFRVWQNALMDKQMSQQEMWQWVHFCYGDELGLTSDDEDYIPPNNEDDKLTVGQRLSVESVIDDISPSIPTRSLNLDDDLFNVLGNDEKVGNPLPKSRNIRLSKSITDSSESDLDDIKTSKPIEQKLKNPLRKEIKRKIIPLCTASHEGRCLVNAIMPLHIDNLFTLLFTNSKFYLDFHESRSTSDLMATTWLENETTGQKYRTVTLTVALNASVGPKVSNVTETQVMLPISTPGLLYSIDVESVNANIPYADSFYVTVHYCMSFVNELESQLQVYAQVKYRKNIWGLVKGMIEKNCWAGMDDYFQALTQALIKHSEIIEPKHPLKRRAPRPPRKRTTNIIQPIELYQVPQGTLIGPANLLENKTLNGVVNRSSVDITTWIIFGILILLVFLNAVLYVKLWVLEDESSFLYSNVDINSIKQHLPKSHDEWLELLQTQEKIHTKEMHKWHQILRHTIDLLRKAEDSLSKLQLELHTNPNTILSNIGNVISSLEETISITTHENSKKVDEL